MAIALEGVGERFGKVVTSVSPNRRPVNMVFQQYALFPHMSTYDNVAFGLRVKRVPRQEHRERIGKVTLVRTTSKATAQSSNDV